MSLCIFPFNRKSKIREFRDSYINITLQGLRKKYNIYRNSNYPFILKKGLHKRCAEEEFTFLLASLEDIYFHYWKYASPHTTRKL